MKTVKKTKFNTLAYIALDKISTSFRDKCIISGGCIKIGPLYSIDEFTKSNKEISGIILRVFGKKPSKICKINHFNSNLYLCFKKKIKY